jgi:SAM-dependent methyltransferase
MSEAEETMWWYRALHSRLIDIVVSLNLAAGAAVLDAGCGTGGFLKRLNRVVPGLDSVGVERDSEAAAVARRKSGSDIARADVGALPFGADRFDVIVAADVLYHQTVDERAAVAEFRRCLRRGGSLILHLPAYEWMKSTHDDRVHTARRYTARRVRGSLMEAGFVAKEVGYRNGFLFPLMAAWRLTAGRSSSESDTHAFPRWQERVFHSIARTEDRMAKHGIRLPFGGSVYARAVKA